MARLPAMPDETPPASGPTSGPGSGPASSGSDAAFPLSERAFVTLLAALMALNALAIDSMLPALPAIGDALGAASANDRQYVISAYLLGSGVGSLISGPLSDRFGRKPVLMVSLFGYILCATASAAARDFDFLLAMRLLHGLVASTFGVVTISVVRDRFSGDRMARIMSTIFLVFMVVPVIAPSFGQAVLAVASWQTIFAALGVMAALVGGWMWLALPETLPPAARQPLSAPTLLRTWRDVATHRLSLYILAAGVIMGALFGFLNSSQQIFAETFGAESWFPLAFAAVASTMAAANYFNSRIVERFGARRVSQTALIAFIALSVAQLVAALSGVETMAMFLVLIALNMGMVGFTGANFGAIAMEPFGRVAGAASAYQSFIRMGFGALLGAFIGQQFDGSTLPLAIGFLVCGLIALGLVLLAERGRLFTRPNAPRCPAPL